MESKTTTVDPIAARSRGMLAMLTMRQVGHALLQLAQAGAHELLPLLGHVVLGVLAEIAHGDRLLQLLGQFVVQLVFEDCDLSWQLLLMCSGILRS